MPWTPPAGNGAMAGGPAGGVAATERFSGVAGELPGRQPARTAVSATSAAATRRDRALRRERPAPRRSDAERHRDIQALFVASHRQFQYEVGAADKFRWSAGEFPAGNEHNFGVWIGCGGDGSRKRRCEVGEGRARRMLFKYDHHRSVETCDERGKIGCNFSTQCAFGAQRYFGNSRIRGCT